MPANERKPRVLPSEMVSSLDSTLAALVLSERYEAIAVHRCSGYCPSWTKQRNVAGLSRHPELTLRSVDLELADLGGVDRIFRSVRVGKST